MKKVIEIQNWNRKEEYQFFRTFFNPMISVTVEVDCTLAYRRAKELGVSFFLYYLHAAVIAVNYIEEFRYRQEGEEVVLYDRIDVVTPIQMDGGNYRSVRLAALEDLPDFIAGAGKAIEAAKYGEGAVHSEEDEGRDVVVMSVNPWYCFTQVQLAIPAEPQQSIPIFTFGKMSEQDGRQRMPVALSVNHGFVSGYQIGLYLEKFQRLLDREEVS